MVKEPQQITTPVPPGRKWRQAMRFKARAKVELRVGAVGSLSSNIAMGLLNVSEEGAEVLSKVAVDPGRRVELQFWGPEQPRPMVVLARVRRCDTEEDALYSIGLKFEERMSIEDLNKFVYAK
jgi:hypothetical protein